MKRKMNLCSLVGIWKERSPTSRQFTFDKRQARNHTRARLDYFLVSETSTENVKETGIDHASRLSDHRLIHLQISLTEIKKGRVFWRLKNSLLKDLDYIKECNKVIKRTMKQYSEELRNIEDPSIEQYCDAKSDISNTLLHDVILMEVRSMTLRFEACKKRM